MYISYRKNDQTPNDLLLIVDSWTCFKDHETIQSLVPEGKRLTIRNIPPGATSIIQPLDVYFFRIFKDFIKRVHSFIMAYSSEFIIHHRENILKVLEVVWNQFCNPCFQPFLQYSWRKIGYIDGADQPFYTPVQICFPSDVAQDCQHLGCTSVSFIRCSYCANYLYFNHFVINKDYH